MNRNTTARTTTPVLIVGAGPAGLVAAITLARQSVPVTLIERRTGTSPFPRATGISTRTMELIRSWGLETRVRAAEIDARTEGWMTTTLAAPDGMPVPMGFPTREQALAASPTTPVLAPQDRLEPVLLAHLREYPHADVRFGVELVAMDQDDDGVTAVLREHGSATSTTLRCAYAIGADGAHSTVRANLGIGMQGPGDLGDLITVLFRAPLDEVVGDRRYGLYMIQQSAQIEVFLPAGDGDRWLYSRTWSPGTERWEDYTTARLVDLIHAGAGTTDLPVNILRTGTFAFAAQIADRYRDRRVFLVGDAAHRITPRGATGMNTAIHDGHDLAWKLGWVLNRWAPTDLLDSYETERRPVGVRNTINSARPNRDAADAFAHDLGGRLPHLWQHHGNSRVSTLDLLGPGLALLTGPTGQAWRTASAHIETPVPLAVHSVDHAAAAAFEICTDGAILVRPDGHIAHRWHSTATADELRDSIATAIAGHTAAPLTATVGTES
jgi:putative polyketide hydroxylase